MSTTDPVKPFAVHLLDVGLKEYGDALLCQFGDVSVLIDGAHPGDQNGSTGHKSILNQLSTLLNQAQPPFHVTLIIVTHAHEDHIGCLPTLVANNQLTADFALVTDPLLGWGRVNPDDGSDRAIQDDRVRAVVAALREHVLTEGTDDATLTEIIADAVTLEQRYNQMLDSLAQRGTKVVRHGKNSPQALLTALQAKSVDLRILGPSPTLLAVCAERIRQATDSLIADIVDAFTNDAELTPTSLYRQLVGGAGDFVSDAGRPGAAVNLQSLVTSFRYKGKRFFFGGDMQFEDPEFDDVADLVKNLRKKVKNEGPYAFVKLGHHGSFNAFSETIYQELNANGTSNLFGICAGEQSTQHPNPATLDVLKDHESQIRWARTDHNKQSSFFFKATGSPQITIEQGQLNDSVPNTSDITPEPEEEHEETTTAVETTTVVTGSEGSFVEVTARIPHASTRVTLTIDVEPRASVQTPPPNKPATASSSDRLPPLKIAAGRQLPRLLFVTSKDKLARNIGEREAQHVIAALKASGAQLIDQLPGTGVAQAATRVRQQIRQAGRIEGVVIVGGYDVVPSQTVDCVPRDLQARVSRSGDADNFIVWSDDIYGDADGDLLPELPVSRIPDGNRADLVFAALQAGGNTLGNQRVGVRNIARPFAAEIYRNLPGSKRMMISKPTTFNSTPQYSLGADRVYIMLHGDYTDSSRFWGEETEGNHEAVNIGNLPEKSGAVVFTGCCWGALTVNTPAGRIVNGRTFGQKSPDDSLAMSFLKRGATGFVGCTGSHYSPLQEPYNFFGGPMHEAFWLNYATNRSPAQALFNAKLEYLRGMPHGQTSPNSQAIEYKILRQYTCLGLGW